MKLYYTCAAQTLYQTHTCLLFHSFEEIIKLFLHRAVNHHRPGCVVSPFCATVVAVILAISSSSSSHSPSSSSPNTLLQARLHIPFLCSSASIITPGICQTLAQNRPRALPLWPSNFQKRTASRASQRLMGKLVNAKYQSVTPAAQRPKHNGKKARLYLKATRPFLAGFVHASIRKPAALYSSRMGQLKAMKCGNCHAKRRPANSHPPMDDPSLAKSSSLQEPSFVAASPAAAAQPIRGGIPPTTAPTHVLNAVTAFNGV